MSNFQAKIKDPVGLHARPTAIVVQIASQFDSDIKIHCKDKKGNPKEGNLKSIMNVMALGISQGDEITIEASKNEASGKDDSEKAIAAIKKAMIENHLI